MINKNLSLLLILNMLKIEKTKKDIKYPLNKLYAPKFKFKSPKESPTPLSLNNSNYKDFELECNNEQCLSYEKISSYVICDNEINKNLCSLFVNFKGLFKE